MIPSSVDIARWLEKKTVTGELLQHFSPELFSMLFHLKREFFLASSLPA